MKASRTGQGRHRARGRADRPGPKPVPEPRPATPDRTDYRDPGAQRTWRWVWRLERLALWIAAVSVPAALVVAAGAAWWGVEWPAAVAWVLFGCGLIALCPSIWAANMRINGGEPFDGFGWRLNWKLELRSFVFGLVVLAVVMSVSAELLYTATLH